MTITINGSGTITGASALATTVASPTFTTPNIDSAQFATVSGTAPIYGARAWVNFNGTGTVAIRASGNVSSITDNGTGDYTMNFTTAMPDVNYNAITGVGAIGDTGEYASVINVNVFTTTSLRMRTGYVLSTADALNDRSVVTVAIFR